jgi:peptide-methionine (S)-S-oxide reductase
MNNEIVTLGGGCFWCVEAIFLELRGVLHITSGYMGGHTENPTYAQICTGQTGHAEVINIEFDSTLIPYQTIISLFLTVHDPTTLNRQGNDTGTQYRSVIYYHSKQQEAQAKELIAFFTEQGAWSKPIVTEVSAASTFFPAEDYHQNYFALNGSQPYCSLLIAPKLARFREHYKELLK